MARGRDARAASEAQRVVREGRRPGPHASQYALGDLYNSGRGVPKDYAKRASISRRQAKKDFADAPSDWGSPMYYNGDGVGEDFEKGRRSWPGEWHRRVKRAELSCRANLGAPVPRRPWRRPCDYGKRRKNCTRKAAATGTPGDARTTSASSTSTGWASPKTRARQLVVVQRSLRQGFWAESEESLSISSSGKSGSGD